jgi:diguanylate cyclase
MMVDDEPLNMDVLRIHLQIEGYENFVCVSDSTQAIAKMEEKVPDVLLLDLVMPNLSGFEILEQLGEHETLKHVPVIVLTSSDNAETKLRVLQLGASDFLSKPVDASELALRMRNTLAARAYEQRMKYQDALTQLPNRLLFTQRATSALDQVRVSKLKGAAILVNINRFKLINDSLGPARGDDVLWAFSQRLCRAFNVSADDGFSDVEEQKRFIARMGGDRFVVMVPGVEYQSDVVVPGSPSKSVQELRACIDEFLDMMERPLSVGGQDIYLNVYIGVSTLSETTRSVEHLINDAETAMMHARRRLNTKLAFYSEQMDAKARELLSLENGLRTAVENKEIFVVYQPKVEIKTGRIKGAEALVRWMHPEFGLISPVDFIPLAEDTGMIVSIGEWVLREACARANEWQTLTGEPFNIAVNVSIRQLYEPDFTHLVEQVIKEAGIPPETLVIEITENMIMEEAESNVIKLRQLRDLGVKLSIDDFGTGYSALNYLQRFSMDQLKIDQSFIRPIKSADDHQPIVRALVSLAHDLGMHVVAEGVETKHQLELLANLDCDEFQGYLCSKPVASTAFEQLLRQQLPMMKSA